MTEKTAFGLCVFDETMETGKKACNFYENMIEWWQHVQLEGSAHGSRCVQ